MLANLTCFVDSARRSIAAAIVFGAALIASPAVLAQNAVNTASVATPATVTDPNAANNTATDSDAITRTTNLSLVKTASPNPVVVGQTLTYTLTVGNGGPSAILASDTFSLVESLPAGLSGCSYTPSTGTFNVGTIAPGATGTGTWTNAAIASGGSVTLTITCSVTASAAASITNTATIVPPAGVTDPDCSGGPVTCAGNNTSSVGTTVNRPQLTMLKTASAASFAVGVPASYTLTVTNTGTATTTSNITVVDTIPAGLTIGTLPGGCSAAGQTVTCVFTVPIAPAASTSAIIPVTPTAAAAASVTNTATVSGGGDATCPATARCTSSVTTAVNRADINAAKTAGVATGPSVAGTYTVTYTVTVTNSGTTSGTYGPLSDAPVFPANINISGASWTTSGAGAPAGGSSPTGGAYTLAPAATVLAAGVTHTYNLTITYTYAANTAVTVCAGVPTPGSGLYNAVSLPGGQENGVATDNAACVNTPPPPPFLTMTKTASASPWTVGVPASYTLQVTNTGGVATTAAATITDVIPAGLTIGTLPAGCTAAGQTVTCTIAAGLAVSGSTSFVIPVTPTLAAGTSVTNSATVSGGGDPGCGAQARCTGTVGPTPINAPQLTLTKTASASPWTVGVPASYTLQLSNTGTAATTAVSTISDTIPTGLTIGTLPAGCTAAGQTVTCTVAAGLAAGGSTSFVIPVTPTLAAGASVTNTASVTGGGDPTCPANARCTSTAGPTPINAPQLTLTKTASASPWTVGVPASYTLQLSNTGTAATTAVSTITDTIPTGLTIGTLPAGCTAAGQTVTCTVAAGLAAGGSTSFVIPVTPTLAAGTSVTNTASVSGGGDPTCPADARCTSTAGPTPINAPQLTLLKTASASPWTVGVPASYTLQLSNTGTAATTAVSTITDTIPTGLTIGTLPAGCTAAGQTVTCTVAAGLAAGGSTSFVIPVTPTLAAGTSVTNTASVSGGGDPTCPADARCTSTAGPTPINAPQLAMTKTASVGFGAFTVGVPASYSLDVSNIGTAATTAPATITDTIPTGLTIGTLPAGCTAAGQTVTCTVPAGLAAGGSTSFVIPVTPTLAAGTSVTNTATVSGGGDPTCPADARCTSQITNAVNAPQLTLLKTASASPWTVGVPASYTLQLSNTGTAATTAASTITDTIPAGLTIGTLPAGCTAAGQTVTCTVAAGLAAGGSTSFVIPVTPTLAAGASVTNTASVSGGGDPTCPADARCTSTAGPTPINAPQLTLAKTASASPWTVGVPASYTLQLSNTGTAATTAVSTITDTIPAGLTIGTLPAGCTAAGQTVTCTVAAGLAAGGSTSFVIPVTPTLAAGTSVTNTASVSGGGDPTCPADARCTSTAGPTPINAPQLAMTKTASVGFGAFTVGVPASYSLDVSNIGTAATTAPATITDTIPTGLTIGTLPAGCTAAGQTVTCTVPAGLAAGGSTSFVIPVTPTLAAGTSVTNTATVSGGGDPTCPADARCTSQITNAVNAPQLTLLKTASASPWTVGVPASYTLQLSNTGTAATTAASTITDTIPAGLTIGTLSAGCTAAGQTVTCTVAAGLAAGGSTSFVIPVTPTAAAAPSVTNTASVSGGGDPTCPADARCTSTAGPTPVNATADLSIVKTQSTPNPAVPGQAVTWTVTVTNNGPSDATAVTTADTVSASVTGLSVGGADGASCTVTGQDVNCAFGTVANGATRTYTITGTLAANFTGNLSNTATVTSTTADPTPANNSSTSSTPTAPSADAAIAKTLLTATPVQAGGTVSYQIVVTNAGPSNLVGASVADTIPGQLSGVTWTCTATGSASCGTASGAGNVATTVDIAAGGGNSITIVVTGTAPLTTPSTIAANTATVTVPGGTTDPNPGNNSSTVPAIPVTALVIDAVDDDFTGTPVNGASGGTTATVLTNDTLNGAAATVGAGGNVTLTPGAAPAPAAGSITMNADGTITIAPGTTAGVYTYAYTICEVLNPTNCDTATATIVVDAAVIDAVDDTGTVANGAAGGVGVPNVLVNDTLNGAPATLATVTLTQLNTTNPNVTLDPLTGAVNVAPGTPAGTYVVTYEICEILNPGNCDTATATVTVGAAPIVANPDTGTVANGANGGVAVPNVLVNDTLNGAPATLATVVLTQTATTNPNVTLNPATGEVVVAPNTPAGTYTVTYQICEQLNPTNCSTTTVTVTVGAAPIDAVDDDYTGTPVNGATGGSLPTVLANDTLNGAAATVGAGGNVTLTPGAAPAPAAGSITMNADGTITIAPGTTAGVYTYAYTICEVLNPTNCDTATATIVVDAAVIDAVDDTGTVANGAAGGVGVPNVLVNDTLNGAPATLATVVLQQLNTTNPNVTLNPATGAVNVAPGTPAGTYVVTYEICEILNPGNCDTATATITVGAAPIVANPDTGTVANGANGGVAVPNVLVNDTLNGAPATLATVVLTQTATTNPNVTLNPATGEVVVAPNTPAGTYTVTYQICEQLNPTNCSTTTVTVTVGAAPIDAVDDDYTGTPVNGATGGSLPTVLGNNGNGIDTLNGAQATVGAGGNVTLTPGAAPAPAAGSITMNADGTITIAPGTTAGVYTYAYTICEVLNPTNCDTATATIVVDAAVIDAVDDTGTVANGAAGGVGVPNVLVNDTLNGAPATLATVTLTQLNTTNPNVTLDPLTGAVNVAPGTPAGTYVVTYEICEILNPGNCDTATATVTVGAAPIVANPDTGTVANGANGGVAVPNVLVNDTLNGAPATLATVVLTQTATTNPNVTLNPATGEVVVAPNTPAGTYTVTYQICEQLNPTNCSTTTVTVTVGAAPIDAVDDDYTGTPVNGATGGSLPTVLGNNGNGIDTLNGAQATVGAGGNVTLTPGAAPAPAAGSITMNADGTITIAPGTTAGVYTYAYTICEVLNPTNCDTATATIVVDAAVIDAVDDTGTVANGAAGGVGVPNVLVNDTLNGAPATLATVTLTQLNTTNPNVTLDPLTGAVNVAPGTPAGTYVVTYEICEILNPGNCDTATATITVGAAPIVANPDTGTVANGANGGVAVPNVLVNDTLNGAPATLATVVLTQTATTNPNVTLNPATGEVVVAPNTPAGTYTVTYQICEQLNPTNCSTTTVTVTVGAAPIDAVDDDYTGTPVNGATGGSLPTVLANDTLNGAAATVGAGGNVTLTPGAAPAPAAGSITMNADGTITIAPGTTAGVYTYAYTICEVLNPTNCDTATATIVVDAAVIDAVDDTGTVANGAAGGVGVPNVLVNDTLNGAPATLATVVLQQLNTTNPNVTLNPATGAVNVAPGTPAGTYVVTYEICEILNPGNCDTATATITVGAAPIVANPDTGTVANGANGGVAVPNVLVNDTLNGAPATLATVVLTQTATTNPNVTLNPATGEVVVAPNTPAGTYTVTYQICEQLNPTNCSTTTVTVTVGAAPIDAVDDDYTGTPVNGATGGSLPTVLANDTLNGAAATVGAGGNVTLTPGAAPAPAAGSITMNADGTITIAPGTTAGVYTYAYTICEVLNPTNCDTATATIVVDAAVIDAVDDTGTVANGAAGGVGVPNVLVNDTLNGAPATLATVTLTQLNTTNPNVTLDPLTGAVNVAPGTPAGTYVVTYEICEILNPGNCDTATATITVGAAPIVANPDTATGINGATGATGVVNVLTNDTLDGNPATLANTTITNVVPATPIGGGPVPVLNPATGLVDVPAGTPAGTYTITYTLCEQLNPTNCSTTTVTITVNAAPIDAIDDAFGPVNGATGNANVGNAYTNDTLNGAAVNPADITGTVVTPATPIGGGPVPVLDPATGVVSVPAGTPAGTYTIVYQICEVLNPTNCDTATITVTVGVALIDAIDDTFAAVDGVTGGTTASVLVNDTLNGAAVNPADVTLTPGTAPTPTSGSITMNPDGTITVAPNTEAGTYTYPYTICEVLNPTNCDTAVATVVVSAQPGLALDKTAGTPNGSTAGSTIPYSFLVTNTGNVTVTGLVIDDALLDAPATCPVTTLAPGASTTCTGTHTLTQAEVDAGQVVNTATATGSLPGGGTTVSPPDTTTTTIVRAPAISATKTATLTGDGGVAGAADVGDVVTYAVTVTNNGNVTMTLDSVMDSLEGRTAVALTCAPTTLAPGQTATCNSYTYTLTDSDITTVGPTLDNMVTATGTSSGTAQTVSSTSSAVVAVNAAPATVRVTKVASPRDVKVGDLVRYTVTMQNTSQTPVVDGTLIDTPPAGFTYVEGSLTVADADNNGRLVGTYPIRVDRIDIPGEGRATITYLLRVGAGVRPGIHTNSAVVEDNGSVVSNVATADVQLTGDPMLEESLIVGSVFNDTNGNGLQDEGERGVPGVRIATVEGILVETDQHGRYHLTGMNGGRWERGRNIILKVDPATLPPGTTFTTDNPLVKRVTPGLPARFDFGVKLVQGTFEGGTKAVEMELGSVMFAPGSAEIRPEYRAAIDKMAETTQGFGGGEVIVAAEGDSDLLAFERAVAVRDALVAKLPPAVASALRISVRANPQDPASTVVGVMDWPLIGTFLFETDSAEIKPEYLPLIRRIAEYMAEIGTTRVAVVGHADKRGSEEHNVALGMRRAKAVQEAIAEALPAEMRNGVKVDFNVDPAAPAGMNGQ